MHESTPNGDLRERFIAAGLRLLDEHGAAELTVRRVAEQARSSTMGIYSQFGGRPGLLEAIYRHGFEQLRADLMAGYPASTFVNNPRNEGPRCLEPAA